MPVAAPPAATANFASNAPGSAPQTSGYNAAQANLLNSLQGTQNLYAGQQQQAGQQLQQNQGRVQQNSINSGLGNTSVAQTLQQAPQQTYNNAMLNIAGAQNQAQSQAYGQLAGVQAQGGQAASNYAAPFAQSQYVQQQQQQAANKQYQGQFMAGQQNPYGLGAMPYAPPYPPQTSAY